MSDHDVETGTDTPTKVEKDCPMSPSVVTIESKSSQSISTEDDEERVTPCKTKTKAFLCGAITQFKYFYSLCLLVFAIVIVHASIFTEQTVGVEKGVPAVAAFFIIWFLILWLGIMEGGQGDLVGLQHVEKSKYAETHTITLKNTELAHKGDNMGRFIVGRQFLTFLVIFVTNMMGSAASGAEVFGFPQWLNAIFLDNGVAMILFVVTLGQLAPQVNAADCMLDFINNRVMLYGVTYVALAIEASGLLHCVYLVQIMFSKITGQVVESKEPPRTTFQNCFFWGRVLVSLTVLGFSLAVILEALFKEQTAMWEGVPPYVSVIVFFALMCFVGMMEGMQIAMFAVMKMPEQELANHSVAKANCELIFMDGNLESFLIGRQICVTLCMFVVARVSSISVAEGEENIFGVSDSFQEFFDTGILGAIVTTVFASLAWRIIASSFPLPFLSNPLIYLITRICLLLDATGVCSASKIIARLQAKVVGYKPDQTYINISEPEPEPEREPEPTPEPDPEPVTVFDTMDDDTKQELQKTINYFDESFRN